MLTPQVSPVVCVCRHVESQQQQGYRLSLYQASNDLNFNPSTAAQRRVEEGQGSASAVCLFFVCLLRKHWKDRTARSLVLRARSKELLFCSEAQGQGQGQG